MAQHNERQVYHVVPDASAEKWLVTQEDASFRKEFQSKEEAIEFAKERAREAQLGQVKVHTRDGNMEYESTYGRDPERYRS
jgi:Uncharacterized protein conserved in bacteria (DUF2188)